MSEQTIRVEIYNQTYSIRSDGDNEYIQDLAQYVDSKMREISSGTMTVDSLKVAILAALHIADEYYQLKSSQAQSDAQLAARSSECSDMLDRILKNREPQVIEDFGCFGRVDLVQKLVGLFLARISFDVKSKLPLQLAQNLFRLVFLRRQEFSDTTRILGDSHNLEVRRDLVSELAPWFLKRDSPGYREFANGRDVDSSGLPYSLHQGIIIRL